MLLWKVRLGKVRISREKNRHTAHDLQVLLLLIQKESSGSDRAGKLRLVRKTIDKEFLIYGENIDNRLAGRRLEPDSTGNLWTSTKRRTSFHEEPGRVTKWKTK